MSGPKAGWVTIENQRRLEELQLEREAQERSELEALRRRERQAWEEQRLKELEERERRRAERERLRAEARAEAARRERQPALEAHQRLIARIEAAMPQRGALQAAHPGLTLPEPPSYVPDPGGDAEALRQATTRLEADVLRYQRDLDVAVSRWQREQAAQSAVADTQERMAAFRAMPLRSADDLYAALQQRCAGLEQRVGQQAQLSALARSARGRLHDAQQDRVDVSDATLDALDALHEAPTLPAAQGAFARLESCIATDRRATQEARRKLAQAEAHAAEQRRIRQQAEDEQRRQEIVAQELRAVLEEQGYVVDDIQQTAVPGADGLVAILPGRWDHAVHVKVGSSGAVRFAPVRLVDPVAAPDGEADRERQQREDQEFDSAFCRGNGGGELAKVLTALRDRGQPDTGATLDVRLRPEPGVANPVERLPTTVLSQEVQARRKAALPKGVPGLRSLRPGGD